MVSWLWHVCAGSVHQVKLRRMFLGRYPHRPLLYGGVGGKFSKRVNVLIYLPSHGLNAVNLVLQSVYLIRSFQRYISRVLKQFHQACKTTMLLQEFSDLSNGNNFFKSEANFRRTNRALEESPRQRRRKPERVDRRFSFYYYGGL